VDEGGHIASCEHPVTHRTSCLAAFVTKAATGEAHVLRLAPTEEGVLEAQLPEAYDNDHLHVVVEGGQFMLVGARMNGLPVLSRHDGPDHYTELWCNAEGEFVDPASPLKQAAEGLGLDTGRSIDLNAWVVHDPRTLTNSQETFIATTESTDKTLVIEVGYEALMRTPPKRVAPEDTPRGIAGGDKEVVASYETASTYMPNLVGAFALRVVAASGQ
jgi:hypothetical protein